MIKILFFIEKLTYNGFIGGAEKVLINLVNNMDHDKYDITVQTVYPEEISSVLSSKIHYCSIYPKKDRLRELLFRVECELGSLYRLHMRKNYDIEVAFLEFCSTKVIAASTNKRAKKYAWVHCDLEIGVIDKEKFVKKNKEKYKRFDSVVCVSEKCKDSFWELFPEITNVQVLHNVIDSEEVIKKAHETLPCDIKKKRFTIVTVARFSPPKNYPRLIQATKRLFTEGYDFDLWIVGDGEQRPLIEGLIESNNLRGRVRLMGFQKNPYPYMREADLLVCSSNYEGFSTFITEGLILGKAILTTECSGMRELLGDSEYGIVVDNSDAGFYQGMRYILENKELVVQYEKKSLKRGRMFMKERLVNDITRFIVEGAEDK